MTRHLEYLSQKGYLAHGHRDLYYEKVEKKCLAARNLPMKEDVKGCKDFQGKKLCMLLDGVKEEEMGIPSDGLLSGGMECQAGLQLQRGAFRCHRELFLLFRCAGQGAGVNNSPFSVRRREEGGVMKRIVKQTDPWRFFWLISVNGKHINETVRAENVEFSIKVDSKAYSEEESDLRGFQGTKACFLLNLHCLFEAELGSALEPEGQLIQELALDIDFGTAGLPKEVLELCYRMLREAGYGDVPALQRYDERMDNFSKGATPPFA